MHHVWLIMAIGFSYALASVPFGYIVGRLWKGVDVQTKGSGNIGATNVLRVLGWGPALVVLFCDLGKGALSVYLGNIAYGTWGAALCGIAAAFGGTHSAFLRLRGGKGIGVGAGIIIITMPVVAAVLAPIWVVVVGLTRYVSLGSVIVAALAPVVTYVLHYPLEYVVLAGAVGGLAIVKHHSNIKRLISGKELKLGEKAK